MHGDYLDGRHFFPHRNGCLPLRVYTKILLSFYLTALTEDADSIGDGVEAEHDTRQGLYLQLYGEGPARSWRSTRPLQADHRYLVELANHLLKNWAENTAVICGWMQQARDDGRGDVESYRKINCVNRDETAQPATYILSVPWIKHPVEINELRYAIKADHATTTARLTTHASGDETISQYTALEAYPALLTTYVPLQALGNKMDRHFFGKKFHDQQHGGAISIARRYRNTQRQNALDHQGRIYLRTACSTSGHVRTKP